jgi:arylsulfatase A-like enzyme
LGQALRGAGYHTHAIGKWHNDKASFNRSFANGNALFFGGMDDQWHTAVQPYDPTGVYDQATAGDGTKHSTDVFCDAAIDFLNDYEREDPFFLYVAFTSPHDPRTAPEPFASKYKPEDIPLPPNFLTEHPFDNGDLTRLRQGCFLRREDG